MLLQAYFHQRTESCRDSQVQMTAESTGLKVKEFSEHVLDLKVPYYSHFPFGPKLMEPLHTLNCPEEEA